LDPLYKKTVPYQPLSWYLGLDPTQGSHSRPPFISKNRLPQKGFKWIGLDAWQASIIYTNLISSNISTPLVASRLKLLPKAQGPFTEALRKNNLNAEAALRAVGGSLERHAITGEVLTLNLSSTRIDNDDLEHLAVLFQPRVLDLTNTDITDAAALHLSGWASLRRLKLGRTRITQTAVSNIKYYSPGLSIQ
jgi:hypothetical protein